MSYSSTNWKSQVSYMNLFSKSFENAMQRENIEQDDKLRRENQIDHLMGLCSL